MRRVKLRTTRRRTVLGNSLMGTTERAGRKSFHSPVSKSRCDPLYSLSQAMTKDGLWHSTMKGCCGTFQCCLRGTTSGNHAVVLKQCNIKIHEYLISVWIKDLSVKGALGKTACAERWLGRE